MRRRLLLALALVALLVPFAAACGGGDDEVPGDAIAVVGGEEISKAEYDALLDRARRSFRERQQPFPKAGTREFNALKAQAVAFLVQREQFEQRANDLDITVSDRDVDTRLEQMKRQYFAGNDKRFEQQLKRSGFTEEQLRRDLRAQLIEERLFAELTKNVAVSEREISEHYRENKSDFAQPARRDVRHILVSKRALADRIYAQLRGGADFAKLAKRYSQDPSSKNRGGKLSITRGQTVPPFDRTAFALGKGELSRPVKTRFGYHVIEALTPVTPARTAPLSEVREQIRHQLLEEKRNDVMTEWVKETRKDYEDETTYQVGFAPPSAVAEQ